jgi:hypothetical protein
MPASGVVRSTTESESSEPPVNIFVVPSTPASGAEHSFTSSGHYTPEINIFMTPEAPEREELQ